MDLLAAIFAYLGTVTAIIIAVAASYDVFIYTPTHSVYPQHTLTIAAKAVAAPGAAKAASSSSAGKIAPPSRPVAAVSRSATSVEAAPQIDIAAERRAAYLRREAVRQKHIRKLARQTRAREWASQQAPAALGYAAEPSEGLYNTFPYQ